MNKDASISTRLAQPSHKAAYATCAIITAAWCAIHLYVVNYKVLPLTYAIPLLICFWTRNKRLLWSMAIVFYLSAGLEVFWILPKNVLSDSGVWLVFLARATNITIAGVVVHVLLNMRTRLEEQNRYLARSNEELATANEEIAQQNSELSSQAEELESQTEELNAQSEELQAMNEELSVREEMLSGMLEASGSLCGEREVLRYVCEQGLHLMGHGLYAAAVLRVRGETLSLVAQFGENDGGQDGREWPLDRALAQLVIEQNRTAGIEDMRLRDDLSFPNCSGAGPCAVLAVPLRSEDKPVGVVEFYCSQERIWSQDDFRLAEWVARQCSLALEAIRLREDLRASEEQLRLAVEAGNVGIWDYNLVNGQVYWDDKARRMFGLPTTDPIDYERVISIIHAEDRDSVRQAVAEAIAPTSDGRYEIQYRVDWPDGNVRWVAANGQAFFEGEGSGRHPVRFTGTVADITAGKRSEEALREYADARERLLDAERAARTEAERIARIKDEFLATVSHELRTPLSSIVGWTRLLLSGKAGDTHHALQIVDRSAASLTQIVQDLLDMNRIITGKIQLKQEETDLGLLVTQTAQSVELAARAKGIELQIHLASELPFVCDSNRIQQVIWNMLSNAVKFTPPGGRVSVKIEQAENGARLEVADTGQGISAAFLPHIFDRFRQEDGSAARRHGGLGLGLSIAKFLVELHGGTIEAHSDGEGKGSVFTVWLPRMGAVYQTNEVWALPPSFWPKRDDNETLMHLKGYTIVLVDDDPDACEWVSRILEEMGAAVHVAGSAGEGFRMIPEVRPDILISDISMPDEDGYSLIRRVRALKHARLQPFSIALTAFARSEDRQMALQAGFDEHLAKPLDPASLAQILPKIKARQDRVDDDLTDPAVN